MNRTTGNSTGWRSQHHVLVPHAQGLGAVAVIRSLGRAGYVVHAASDQPDALGLASSYTAERAVCPGYQHPGYLPWLRDYVKRRKICVIIPSEALLVAVRAVYSEFSGMLPVSGCQQAVYRAMSKADLFELLLNSGDRRHVQAHLPPTLVLRQGAPVPSAAHLAHLGLPLFLKADAVHSAAATRSTVYEAADPEDAKARLLELLSEYRKVVVQGYVPGCGVGVFFLRWEDQLLAQFMHRRLHEVPHTGGVSSMRESWWHPAIRNDAFAKLRHVSWQGAAMFEYRYDTGSGAFWLMEMNARFWGSLHLALHAGVDFPTLLVDAFLKRPVTPVTKFRLGICCRHTFPGEVGHVLSRLRDPRITLSGRIASIAKFLALGLDGRIRSDLIFPRDSGLYWRNMRRFLADTARSLSRRVRRTLGRKLRSFQKRPS